MERYKLCLDWCELLVDDSFYMCAALSIMVLALKMIYLFFFTYLKALNVKVSQ